MTGVGMPEAGPSRPAMISPVQTKSAQSWLLRAEVSIVSLDAVVAPASRSAWHGGAGKARASPKPGSPRHPARQGHDRLGVNQHGHDQHGQRQQDAKVVPVGMAENVAWMPRATIHRLMVPGFASQRGPCFERAIVGQPPRSRTTTRSERSIGKSSGGSECARRTFANSPLTSAASRAERNHVRATASGPTPVLPTQALSLTPSYARL
jgi:hypothetical protein